MAAQLEKIAMSRVEMEKRVARCATLQGSDGGRPDSKHPGSERTLYKVICLRPPYYY